MAEPVDLAESTFSANCQDIPGRLEWEALYPTMRDVVFADINQCPPFLRHHFMLELLDGNFSIPSKPYLYMQHQTYIQELKKNQDTFDALMTEFVKGPGQHYWCLNSKSTDNTTSTVTTHVPREFYCVPRPINTAPPVNTVVPALGARGATGVKYTFHRFQPGHDDSDDSGTDSSMEATNKHSNFQVFNTNLQQCKPWMSLEKEITQCLLDSNLMTPTNKPLLDLEDSLFDLATYPNCCDGIFYCSAFLVKDCVYIRYLEGGAYTGCFPAVRTELESVLPSNDLVWWQVYNECDMKRVRTSKLQETSKKKTTTKRGNGAPGRPDKAYTNLLTTNAKSVRSSLVKLGEQEVDADQCKLLGTVVHTKYRAHQQVLDHNKSDRWFINFSDILASLSQNIELLLKEFPTKALPSVDHDYSRLISHHLPNKPLISQQCDAISLLPNNPINCQVRRFQHRFSVTTKGCPSSPRNIFLWAYGRRDRHQQFVSSYNKLFCETTDLTETQMPSEQESPTRPVQPSLTRTQVSKRYTLERLQRAVDFTSTSSPACNMMDANISLYANYTTLLVEQGKLFWRLHTTISDVFVMNDYCGETGIFKPVDYVHCSRFLVETGYHYACDCAIYHTLLEQSQDEDGNDGDVSCIHCRLLKQLPLDEIYISDHKGTRLENLFHTAKQSIDKPVLICPTSGATHKFSVLVNEVCTFVHLSYSAHSAKYVICCQSGRCTVMKGSRRCVSYLNTGDLCPHLKQMNDSIHEWNHLLTMQQNDTASDNEDLPLSEDLAPVLEPHIPEPPENEGIFNSEIGQWTFKCESLHSARPDKSEELAKWVQYRDQLIDSNPKCSPRLDGCLKGPDIIPPVPSIVCDCQVSWLNDENPTGILQQQRTILLYTSQAPVICKVFKRLCLQGVCVLHWDEGESQCLHASTTDTCAGDEIGWLFVDRILSGRQSFSGFCQEMSNNYKRRYPESRQFMSPNVFIKWWFSWASNQRKEFRKACPVCKYDPKCLACDGTKIGVVFRNQNVTPIEEVRSEEVYPTLHRRNNRCFLSYRAGTSDEDVRNARDNLRFISEHICGEQRHVDDNLLMEKFNQTLCILPLECRCAFTRMCTGVNLSANEKSALGYVFKLLSATAPISTILPFRYVHDLHTLLNHLSGSINHENGDDLFNRVLCEMRQYAPELRELFASSGADNALKPGCPHSDVVDLFKYIIGRVTLLHDAHIPAQPALPQEGTYNPPKHGRAYYFSKSGCKVRNLRKFSIDVEAAGSNFDDPPDDSERCRKKFPEVSRKGTSHLFLWFCPSHGHCYGFHIIPGSEGRKDPYASLYSYLECPPADVFYDFACNLHEYCLNRESGYYKDVRFFHDIFHGFSHKCSACYRSSRLLGFEHVNSEIAEQFNSFIQCIKYPAKQMSQAHFVFFLQYFIDIWNCRKAERHQNKLRVAYNGAL